MDRETSGLDGIEVIHTLITEYPDSAVVVILPPSRIASKALQALRINISTLLDDSETSGHGASNPTEASDSHSGLTGWQVQRVNRYLDEHLSDSIHVRDLAKITRLSLGHFAHAFKQSFGEPPLVHITHRRLERACERMLASQEPLSWIARDCGFCDQSHFTRHFHRTMGMAPQRWRRLHALGPQ